MKKIYPFFSLFLALLFIIGCGGKPSANTKKEVEIKPFTPPANGKITEQQKDAYIKASIVLDSVMKIYSDNIKDFVDKYKVNQDLSQLADTTFLKKHPDARFVFVGRGPGFEQTQSIANSLGLKLKKAAR